MKYQNRIMALPMLCMIIIVLSACCFDEQKNETSNVNPKVQSVETVSVTRGNLTPTVSAHTTIIPALDFVLCSSVEGTFEACSSAGNKITEGGVIGKVSEEEIKSPVDATILSIISSNESVPKNYPLATAKYTGFALNIEAENFLKILPENAALKAKFQVVDGVGPTEAIAVVVPVSENAESTLQCLIGKDIDVKPGQSATVVITAETRKDVLLLPLSVIAGRQGKGMVTVINDGKQIQTVAPVASVSSLQDISDTVYKKTVPVDVVFTTSTYNKIYNLPMSSGDWFDSSEINKTLCMVVNKAAQNYFDTSYAVGNVESSLSLTPFNVVGTVNDGTDIPTVYLDAHSIELLVPNMWKVKNATVHWHSEAGITMRQMYSSLHDILEDTIGGNLDIIGKSDIGDTYNSVLSVLQLGLLVTSFLLLFVSVLGQINIGLSSLEQRTHELLIRRAIGASRANIVTLVLGAQLTISVSVCIVSILISFFLVQGMGLFLPVDSPVAALEYPILSAVVAVITSVVVALLGGLLPALKAAKLEPALALR